MSLVWILALVALLLPVPIGFVIPVAAGVSPDPWRVRRARLALTGFAGSVAVLQIGLLFVTRAMAGGARPAGLSASGLLVWAPMSWLLLLFLVLELRRPAGAPFPGQTRRTASLRQRHRLDPAQRRAWWLLAALWLPLAGLLLLSAPHRAGAAILLGGTALLLVLAPLLARRGALDAEPLIPGRETALAEAYATRRRLRSRALFSVVGTAVASKTLLAAVLGWRLEASMAFWVLGTTIVALAAVMLTLAVHELRLRRRIRSIGAAAADRDS